MSSKSRQPLDVNSRNAKNECSLYIIDCGVWHVFEKEKQMTIADTINVDWLDEINGMTVCRAIEYLQSLNPMLQLNAYTDDYDHMCSDLLLERQLTPEETKAHTVDIATRELEVYTSALANHEALLAKELANPRDGDRRFRYRHIETCKVRIAYYTNILKELA